MTTLHLLEGIFKQRLLRYMLVVAALTSLILLLCLPSPSLSSASSIGKVAPVSQTAGSLKKPRMLAATYYSLNDNLSATLMLSNQGPSTIEVKPTLFSLSGERFELPPVTLEGATARAFDLQEWVTLAGAVFREGSIQVFYHGNPLELAGMMMLVNPNRSLIFDQELTEPLREFRSSQLEGVWWLPSNKSELKLALSNTTDQPIPVVISVERKRLVAEPETLPLNPRETRVIILQSLDRERGHNLPRHGGISIEHSGAPGAVIACGFVQEPLIGYSSIVEFSDPRSAKSRRLDGAGLRIGSIAGEELEQVAVIRNVGDGLNVVTGRIPYTLADGSRGKVSLPKIELTQGETISINLDKFIKRELRWQNVATAGLELEYTGVPGSVVAMARSYIPDGTHVFRLTLKDAATQPSSTGQYPWTVDDHTSTVVYIKNAASTAQRFTIQVNFSSGDYALGIQNIEAGQTMAYDIRKLRDDQAPDVNGKTIPLEATHGQVHWSLQSADHRTLIGRVEQVDISSGLSMTAACGLCCQDSFMASWLTPANPVGVIYTTNRFTPFRQDKNCWGTPLAPYPLQYPGTGDFSCDHPSVATIDNTGLATAAGLGNTPVRHSILGDIYWPISEWDCGSDFVDASSWTTCEVIPEPPCAVPIRFRQVGDPTQPSIGVLRFQYAWESSTGNPADLNNCTVGEYVDYPGPGPKYRWPRPPFGFAEWDDPTIIDAPATQMGFPDNQTIPGDGLGGAPPSEFIITAFQTYRYRCPCADGGRYVDINKVYIIIDRHVGPNGRGAWKYRVIKSGWYAEVDPIPFT